MSENRIAQVIGAFGLGIFVGAAAALLLAPSSGAVTRRRIERTARKTSERARESLDAATEFVADQAKRVGNAVKEGKQALRG